MGRLHEKAPRSGRLEPTRVKKRLLRETYQTFFSIVREALEASGVRSRGKLHEATYKAFMNKYHVASQLVIEATSYARTIRKTINGDVDRCIIRFDRRLSGFKRTRRGNAILSLRLNQDKIGLPISRDGANQRLTEHLKDGWRLSSTIMSHDFRFLAVLPKQISESTIRPNRMVVGIPMIYATRNKAASEDIAPFKDPC